MNKDNSSLDYIQKKIQELNRKIDICNIFLKHSIRYFPDIFSIKDEIDKSFIFQYDEENIKIINFNYIYSILPNPIISKYKTIIPTPEILDIYKNQNLNFTYLNENLISIKTTPEEETKKIIEDLEHSCDYIKNLDIDKYYKSIIKELKQESKILRNISNKDTKTKIYIRTPNTLIDALNNNQRGTISEIDDKHKNDVINHIIKQIHESKDLTDEEKQKRKDMIVDSNNEDCDISEYMQLKEKYTELENTVQRAVRRMFYTEECKIDEVKPHFNLISMTFPLHIFYKIGCGLNNYGDKGYYYKKSKEIQQVLKESNLHRKIITKHSSFKKKRIVTSSFIVNAILDGRNVDIKTEVEGITKTKTQLTTATIMVDRYFLFINEEDMKKVKRYTLEDIEGRNDLIKINGTTVAARLHQYLERLLSLKNKKRELDLTTIINRLNLEKEYKKRKTRVIEEINRALDDMIKVGTLIKDYEIVKGLNNQEKYVLYNLRYKAKEVLEN
jgi:hypothetical protein